MNKKHEKMMTDLHRLLETQDFKSVEELQQFMDQLVGEKIPSFPTEALSNKEKAEDLVFEAYELKSKKARKFIDMAIHYDPDCIMAYEYLALKEPNPNIAIIFLEKGIAAGRKIFGGEFLKQNKGHFWGIHETRPFIRCLNQYAECLYAVGKKNESIATFEEIIRLNEHDNLGVRDVLTTYLIEMNEDQKFIKYSKMFNESNFAFPTFNRALFSFKTEGDTEKSKKLLQKALKTNKHVANMIIAGESVTNDSDSYSPGDINEAQYYLSFTLPVWQKVNGAVEWLKKHVK